MRQFHGKPMLAYPIETAKASGLFDLIVVSTDDAEIAAVAFKYGATVLPRTPDDGITGTQEIAARVLEQLGVYQGAACVIYPCSPLLLPQDLHEGWGWLTFRNFAMSVGPDGKDAGCFYWGWVRAFRERVPLLGNSNDVPLPAERVCDVNDFSDWYEAEAKFTALRRANEDH